LIDALSVGADARIEIRRALALDPDCINTHYVDGMIYLYHDWDWVRAEKSFNRVLQISPGNLTSLRGLSRLLNTLQRHDQAVRYAKSVVENDPLTCV